MEFPHHVQELLSKSISSNDINSDSPIRRSANYHPSIWGEYFLDFDYDEEEIIMFSQKEKKLKEEIRQILIETPDNSTLKLEFINALQRLGLSYHFEREIEESLLSIYNNTIAENEEYKDDDLYAVSLRFRLLRQQGHYVPTGVFNRFSNNEGKFKESLMINDVQGILSLYEAAHLRVHGEDILEEALIFTTTQLESMLPTLSSFLATQVKQALNMPIHKTLTRLGAIQYMPIYKQDESHNELLLKFSELDFNRLQKMHQSELSGLTKWWKHLDFAKKLPFARDRLVECYFWILGVYFEPKYRLARRISTKVIVMTSVIDDIYDLYGTLDELILFTHAIERWDIHSVDQLPSYIRYFYKALLDVYSEMEEDLAKEGKQNLVNYSKAQMKSLARAYFQEAFWYHNKYVPKFEEYMRVALVSSGYLMVAATSLIGMGELATNKGLDWVTNEPLIVTASATIARLMDDMAGHESEKQRGDVASAVECYMNQYDASKEEAFQELQKHVTNAWKDINKECMKPTKVAMPLLSRVANLARVIDLLYKDEDGYTSSTTKSKEFITLVLVNPATL